MSLKKTLADLEASPRWRRWTPRLMIVAGSLNILISVVRLAAALWMGYVNTFITVQVIVGIVSGSIVRLVGIYLNYRLPLGPNGPSFLDFYRALLTRSCTCASCTCASCTCAS